MFKLKWIILIGMISVIFCLLILSIAQLYYLGKEKSMPYQKNLESLLDIPHMAGGNINTTAFKRRIANLERLLEEGNAYKSSKNNRIIELEHRVKQLEQKFEQRTTASSLTLPSCQELMQRKDSPYADGYFLTRHTTPNSWTPRADGSREFDLTSICKLKRYTSQEARQCLKGEHVNFIGDSLTRYQFLSLAYFIDKGTYPPHFGRETKEMPCQHFDESGNPACSKINEPNVCMEHDWKEDEVKGKKRVDPWIRFFRALGGSDDGGIFQGRMECQCARRKRVNQALTTENQLYVSKEMDSKRVILSFINEAGWKSDIRPIHGFDFNRCAYNGTCRYSMATSEEQLKRASEENWDWESPLSNALAENGLLRKQLPPVNISIYNRGLWGPLNKTAAELVMPMLYSFTGGEKGRCFFKSTTGSGRTLHLKQSEMFETRIEALKAGCGYIDYAHVTDDFAQLRWYPKKPPKQANGKIWTYNERQNIYWDEVHFMPWVYEELNNILLNILCNWKS